MRIFNPFTTVTNTVTQIGGTAKHTASGTSVTVTYSPTAGNYVVIFICSDSGSPGVMSCADNNSNTLTRILETSQRGDSHGGALFAGVAVSGATSYTITWSGASATSTSLEEYSNVASVGASSKTEGGDGSNHTGPASWSNAQSVTTTGNKIVSGFGFCTVGTTGTSTTTGTLRQHEGSGNDYSSIIDNTNTSGNTAAGATTDSYFSWACASVELVATTSTVASSANYVING